MAKGNILKEAIADAKAVREVALANAKAALEEAFTPKLQNMLSAKLSEDLDEDMYDEDEKELDFYFYELEKILNGKTIVCHNVKFDKNLIEQSLANYNLSLPKNINWICTKDI